jgi:hypothetical protein
MTRIFFIELTQIVAKRCFERQKINVTEDTITLLLSQA